MAIDWKRSFRSAFIQPTTDDSLTFFIYIYCSQMYVTLTIQKKICCYFCFIVTLKHVTQLVKNNIAVIYQSSVHSV